MSFSLCRRVEATKSFYRLLRRNINVLGIESSCDDTSAAVVNDSGHILGEEHFSQSKIHVEAGGIIPIIAHNLHRQCLRNVVESSVKQSLIDIKDLDAIAVTVKPGLILSLKAGVEFAKDLCFLYSKPLIPIHHMEAHALTARMVEDVKFPFLTLLMSGGHCILALVKSVDKFYTLGNSLDNSPGHALDLIARRAKLKNLKKFKGLAGGAAIEAAAVDGDSSRFAFTTARISRRDCNFSFSSLLNEAMTYIKAEELKHNLKPDEVIPNINDLCAGVLLGLVRNLCRRLEVAFHYVHMCELLKENEKCVVISGGVACNSFVQRAVKKVCDKYYYRFLVPPSKLCSDNGVMIAWNGIERLRENLPSVQPNNLHSVTELAKCPLGENISEDVNEKGRAMTFKFVKLTHSDVFDSENRLSEDSENRKELSGSNLNLMKRSAKSKRSSKI